MSGVLIIGLTGSIGMGKSTASKRFAALGFPVCDADALVHDLYRTTAVAPIEAAFPGVVKDGSIDRATLSAQLMAEPSGFKRLEAIVHPLVHTAERDWLHQAKRTGAAMAVLEIPLLFETGGEKRCDVTVVVSAPAHMQRARVLARAGMTEAKLDGILARQLPDAEKRRRATFVVDTGGTHAETEAGVDRVVAELHGRVGTAFATHWA
jgi:dephospho-CoA kinase